MTEAGYPSEWNQQLGAVEVKGVNGNQGAMRGAADECAERLGGYPTFAPFTDEELGALFELELKTYQCLLDHGYQPEPPSSKEQFVATYRTGDSWYSYRLPPGQTLTQSAEMECPQPRPADIEWD